MFRLLEYFLVRSLLGALQVLSYPASLRLAQTLARLLYRFNSVPRDRVIGNLRLVYGPQLSREETHHIAAGVFETISRHVAEVAHVPRRQALGVRLEHPEILTDAYARGQGVVVVSAHMGCFVRMFTFPRLLGLRVAAVMKKQRNERLLEWSRGHIKKCFDIDVVVKKEARDRVPDYLREGRVVVLFADQHPRKGGFLATFFGHPVSAAAGPAVYAKRCRTPLIVATSALHSDGMHVVRFDGPISTEGTHEEISQRWLDVLEARIREHPEQWMWMHRRWRDLPPAALLTGDPGESEGDRPGGSLNEEGRLLPLP